MAEPTLRLVKPDPLLSEIPTDDSQSRLQKYRRMFRDATTARAKWEAQAQESYQFVTGGDLQWKESDLAWLRRPGKERPIITINRVLRNVLWMTGLQRQLRTEPKLLPAEAGDVAATEVMGVLYKWVGGKSREVLVDSKVFDHKVVSGLGWWKVVVDLDDDPEGTPAWSAPHPLSVFPDPNWLDCGWEKAAWCIHAEWMTIDAAKDAWPEYAEEIQSKYGPWLHGEGLSGAGTDETFAGDTQADQRTWWDPETQRVRILEIWTLRRQVVEVAIDPATNDVIQDPAELERVKQAVSQGLLPPGAVTLTKRPIKTVTMSHMLRDTLLDDNVPSPFERQEIPIFPTIGFYWWQTPFGIVEPQKDLQREKNRRRSTMTEIAMKATQSGWMNKRDGGADSRELEAQVAGTGKIINFEEVAPTAITPPDMPQNLVLLERMADQEIDAVVNINAEMSGNVTQKTVSGRAIEARQRGGMVSQQPLLIGFYDDKVAAAKFMIQAIKQYISLPRALRILGTMAARFPENQNFQAFASPNDAVQQALQGAYSVDYDVVIDQKPFEPSLNQQRWDVLVDMVERFGPVIPPDVLVETAKDAGLITEAHGQRILQHLQQQQAAVQGARPGTPVDSKPGLAVPP